MNAIASSTATSPLLDAGATLLHARPLRSWPVSAREKLQARMIALCQEWAAEWLPAYNNGVSGFTVEVSDATTAPSDPEDEVRWSFASAPRRVPSPSNASGTPLPEPVAFIATALFDGDSGSPRPMGIATPRIADNIAHAAWDDWTQRLSNALDNFPLAQQQYAPMSPGAKARSHTWSGALQAQWPWCGGSWTLVLPHDAVAALVGFVEPTASLSHDATAPKEALDRVLAGERLTLRVLLDGAELNLGQLQGLQINDVVRLSHPLDAPAQVVGLDGNTVCDGWLGRSEDRMAIELTAHAHSTTGLVPGSSSSKERKS